MESLALCGSSQLSGCLLRDSRICHLDWNLQAPSQSCLCFSPPVFQLILSVCLWWFFTCNQATAQGLLISDPQRVRAAEVYQSDVNLSVFCSHFNGDKELSFGNRLSAWRKAFLPFKGKEVVGGGSFVWRPEKSDRGRHTTLPNRRSRLQHLSSWQETLWNEILPK